MRHLVVAVIFGAVACSALAQSSPPLVLTKTVPLPGVTGKFDHFAADTANNRLFIAATGNHSVEVADLSPGRVAQSITGLGKPHGLVWIADLGRLYASDGSQADLKVFGGSPLTRSTSLKLSDDADDMVYDPKTKLLYVGHGGSGADAPARIAVIDTLQNSLITNLSVSTHPEGFDIDSVQDRIFANIADSAEVVVIDGATHAISATWKLTRAKDNVPLAYDADHQVLFVACRTPGRLLMLDGNSGKELADLPADSGVDDLFYNSALHHVYLIAGSGFIDVYEIDSSRAVKAIGVIKTASGAKTGLFVPTQNALYIGVPGTSGKNSEIRVYSTGAGK